MSRKTPAYNWDDLRFLLAVYRTGTMTAAARELGTNVATVSRRLDRLADELGGTPFLKTPSGWRPSPRIGGLLAAATSFEGQMQRLAGEAPSPAELPRIRLGAASSIIAMVLTPHLAARSSPMGRIDLEIVQRSFDNGLAGHDVIIQPAEATSNLLVSRPLGSLSFGVYRWRGTAQTDRWLGLSEAHDSKHVMRRAHALFRRPPMLRLGDFEKVYQASRLLRLPATLPDLYACAEPQLIRVDPPSDMETSAYWLVHHRSRLDDAAMRIVADWVAEAFDAVQGVERGAANLGT